MSNAFSAAEKQLITEKLLQGAWRHACCEGMRKTTVDTLAAEASISKGAFYHFYASKEELFLSMLERWQQHAYDAAAQVLDTHADLPVAVRASMAFRAAFQYIMEQPIGRFLADEVPIMLSRLPESTLREHYQSQEEFVLRIIRQVGVHLTVPDHTAVAAVCILMLSLVNAERVEYYNDGIDVLVDSVCKQLIRE